MLQECRHEYSCRGDQKCQHSGSFSLIRILPGILGEPFSIAVVLADDHRILNIPGSYIFYTSGIFMTEPDKNTESQAPDAILFPWWLLLLWGILTIIIGLMFLLTPGITTVLFITFLGAYWLVGGLFVLGSLVVDRTNMGMKILLFGINVIAGILILLHPFFSAFFALGFFVIFIGFWACFIGAVHLYQGFTTKDIGNGVLGIISLIFGVLVLAHPFIAAAILPFVAGGFCIISGLAALCVSYAAKSV
jgi:uncharacterized membrane protein HdeD (DUF308 family)